MKEFPRLLMREKMEPSAPEIPFCEWLRRQSDSFLQKKFEVF
jgi:hypothetical protein